MKRILLFFMSLLFVISSAHAQEDEKLQPKGLLYDRPISTTPDVYTDGLVLLDVDAATLATWNTQHWKVTPEGLSTGLYAKGSVSSVESPSIVLPSLSGSSERLNVYIKEWFEIESFHDKGLVQISADKGATWKTLSVVDGKSDWHTSVVNVTEYAGKEITLAFRLVADRANQYRGWTIGGLTLKKEVLPDAGRRSELSVGTPASKAARAGGSVGVLAAMSGRMTGVDAQWFPRYIMSHLSVEDGGVPLLTLTKDNFFVREYIPNGVGGVDTLTTARDETFFVYTPLVDTIKKPVDIVFLMDNSGSMTEERAGVAANVAAFVQQLQDSSYDFRLGLCRFGQSTGNGIPLFHDNARFYTSAQEYITVWNAVNTIDGGTEPAWDALYQSAAQYSFRPGAQRIFILITDETIQGSNMNAQIIKDRQVIINQLVNSGVKTYTVVSAGPIFEQDYGTIATATGGRSYLITNPFNDILRDIGVEISGSYAIRYTPTSPLFDGLRRTVEVKVNYGGSTLTLFGNYTPGAAPAILRTNATMALHTTPQLNNQPKKIEVEATDWDNIVTNACTLYYRLAGSNAAYKILNMTRTSNAPGTPTKSVWEATIPAVDAQEPGIQYYIRATDGQATTITPEFIDRVGYPYSFAILPNIAPLIVHTPTETIDPKQPLVITATITDNTTQLNPASLKIRWRKDLEITEHEASLVPVAGSPDQYTFTIPAVNENTMLYYSIVAEDNFRISTTHGPHSVAVGIPWSIPPVGAPFHTIRLFTSGLYASTVRNENEVLAPGDIIGVFFTNPAGELKPAGSVTWPSQSLVAYGDNTNTPLLDGFTTGQGFTFKIYKKATGDVFNTDLELYTQTPSVSVWGSNKQTFIKSIYGWAEQFITLQQGTNYWSTYMFPKSNSFADLFAPILSEVDYVMDSEGREWKPAGPSAITNYVPAYGYSVFMKSAQTLKVKGARLKLAPSNFSVNIADEGTLIGSPYQAPESVEAVFPPFGPDIFILDRYIVNSDNSFIIESYLPAWGDNGWTNKNLEPGKSYKAWSFADMTFTFPAPLGPFVAARTAGKTAANTRSQQVITTVDKYMHVLIPAGAWADQPSSSDEVRIYNRDGKLLAKAAVKEHGTVVTLDGAKIKGNENFYLRFWNQAELTEKPLYVAEWKSGVNKYENLSATIVGKFLSEDAVGLNGALTVFPNPMIAEGAVRFTLPQEEDVTVELYDLQGGTFKRALVQQRYAKGKHEVTFNKQALNPGIYFVKFITGSTFETKRIVVK
ncbi:T9SS type A sorting domain-containing protein [Fulvivirgaceae bacterium PWU5]|uniref:T9SS type A sorting domain-containing protein n=1 Tax=Dawidia cretensis TaxID=2782350 RepID=A0AAP2GVB9_9BACT|nr:T9SS type A sorting domain-containing protein [Dawidia cretensis]MBT1708762.1 T9SS type A sorting domain-containing protein [Dawidia cretensis]